MSNRGLSNDLMDDIRRGVRHGRADAIFAILLLLCTNLRVWMTSFERECSDSLVVRTISHVLTSNSALQHLHEFTLQFAIAKDVAGL